MKVLVTAFEPFNGGTINPSQLILEQLETPTGIELIKILLPVEFKTTTKILKELLQEHQPDIVISLGQAGNRPEICVERVAVNLDCVRSSDGARELADNAGEKPVDVPIAEDGPAAYFSTLPVWDLVAVIKAQNVAGAASYSAGTYVCNHVMYTELYEVSKNYPNMKAGFIHVPFLPEQIADREDKSRLAAMPLEEMVIALQTVLEVLAKG